MFDLSACFVHVYSKSPGVFLAGLCGVANLSGSLLSVSGSSVQRSGGSQPLSWHRRVVMGRIFQKESVPSHTSLSHLQSPSTEANISNPCYPQGYSTTFTLGHVFGSLCTEKQRPETYNPSDNVTFTGTGDPRLCREKVASVFDFSACQDQDACSFDGIYQPKVQGPFVVRAAGGEGWRGALHPGRASAPFPCSILLLTSPSPGSSIALTVSVLLAGVCRFLLHSQCAKPLGKLLPYLLQ